MEKERALLEFLEEYITDSRKELFDNVLAQRTRHLTVVAEDIYQSQNASALIRNCECFGVQELHIIENENGYKLNPDVAQGADKWVDMSYHRAKGVDNSQACIDALRAEGYQIVATTPHTNDCTLDEFDVTKPSALFFGSEKPGLTQRVLDQADVYLEIPMVGFTESFNISVSCAIILHHLTLKLRQRSDVDWKLSPEDYLKTRLKWTMSTIERSESMVRYFEKEVWSK